MFCGIRTRSEKFAVNIRSNKIRETTTRNAIPLLVPEQSFHETIVRSFTGSSPNTRKQPDKL